MNKNHRLNLSLQYTTPPKADIVPIEFEHHMLSVLGHYAKSIPEEISDFTLSDLKKLFFNYFNIFERSFIINGKTFDQFLIDDIKDCITYANSEIKRSKSKTEICLIMITALSKINFKMLGGIPNNTSDSRPKPKIQNDDLLLNQYYSIHYSQDSSQKANLICDHVKSYMPEFFEEIQQKRNSIKNDDKFISWVKENEKYAKIYLDLF